MSKWACTVALWILTLPVWAVEPDSLKEVLKSKNLPDTSRVFTLIATGRYFYFEQGMLDSSLLYYEQALQLAKKTKYPKALADAHSGMALMYREKGVFDKALAEYLKALTWSKKTGVPKKIAREYNGIAVVHAIQKNYEKSLEYYGKSEEISKKANDKKGLASVYNNIGVTLTDKGDPYTALEYYHKGMAINRELKDMRGVATVNENIGLIYTSQLKDHQKAIDHFKESLSIWRSLNDRNSVSITLQYMCMALIEMGQYKKSIDTSMLSLKLAREAGSLTSQREVYYHLHNAYEKLGRIDSAYKYYKYWNTLADSLKNDDKLREITSMQVSYEMDQKRVADSLQTEVKHQFNMGRQKARANWLMAILVFVLLFSIILFIALNRNRRARKEIARQKLTIEQRNREVMDSIRYASRIQNAILPPSEKMKELLADHFVFYQPKDIVSGDFFWVDKKDDLVFMAVVDCTGHGVPGAFMSIMGRNGLHEAVNMRQLTRANEILDFLDSYVKEAIHQTGDHARISDGMDISLCVWNKKTNQLQFSGAQNSLWIFRPTENMSGSTVIEIAADKKSIGHQIIETQVDFTLHEVELKKGDMICMYTDGYADQFGGPKGKKIKYKRLRQMLKQTAHAGTSPVHRELVNFFFEWKGDMEQIDDVCILGIEIK